MKHREKIADLTDEMRNRGVASHVIAPPLFRLLWAMGFNIPPPIFLGFATLALLMGIVFGLLFMALAGFLLWLVFWQGVPFDAVVLRVLFMAAIAGTLYGLWAAWYYRKQAARLGLPTSWKDRATLG